MASRAFHVLRIKSIAWIQSGGKEIGTRKTTQNQTRNNVDLIKGHSFIWLFLQPVHLFSQTCHAAHFEAVWLNRFCVCEEKIEELQLEISTTRC